MSGGGIGGFLAELLPATRAQEVIARGLSPLQESSAVLLPASPRELPLNSEAKGLAGIFFFYQDNKQGLSYSKGVLKGGEINSFLIPVLGGQSWKCYLPYPVMCSIALLAQSCHGDMDFPILRGYVQLVAARGVKDKNPPRTQGSASY